MALQYTLKTNLEKFENLTKLEYVSVQIFTGLISKRDAYEMTTEQIFEYISLSCSVAAGILDECKYIELKTIKYNDK